LARLERKKVRGKFFRARAALKRLITKYVGADNYAGSSSLAQLGRIEEKFLDCFPLDEMPLEVKKSIQAYDKRVFGKK
jgi:hypothetical protein